MDPSDAYELLQSHSLIPILRKLREDEIHTTTPTGNWCWGDGTAEALGARPEEGIRATSFLFQIFFWPRCPGPASWSHGHEEVIKAKIKTQYSPPPKQSLPFIALEFQLSQELAHRLPISGT